jgi:hypothetical protein
MNKFSYFSNLTGPDSGQFFSFLFSLRKPMQEVKVQKRVILLAGLVMILAAFVQCYLTSRDLSWYYDIDVPRDMSYVQQILYGHFGKDPNYTGEFLWYNPLMSIVQAGIIKISGLPINVAMVRLGAYLNLLAPITFFSMMLALLDFRIALAGLLSYLFLASGPIPGFYAATYTPWMYSGVFMQFIFYINIALCYQAFKTQKLGWFLALGVGIGVGFLGHTAPTVLMILILVSLQGTKMFRALKSKNTGVLREYLIQAVAVFIPFLVFSFPFLYFIVGKYHMHFQNRSPFEYVDTIFVWRNYKAMIRENLSVSFLISGFGFIWFYKKFRKPLVREILLNWFWIGLVMFFYSTLVVSLDAHTSIRLPGTVPSFHYFFYLKALQSVFYGFGLFYLAKPVVHWIDNRKFLNTYGPSEKRATHLFIALILLCGIVYFPFYQKRYDFVTFRNLCLEKAEDSANIKAYYYIRDHIPADGVFLCEQHTSIFPVMATARKMVSNGITFSNPYVNFGTRENARNGMLSYLKTGYPDTAYSLFHAYDVGYILLDNSELADYKKLSLVPTSICYRDDSYTIFKVNAP